MKYRKGDKVRFVWNSTETNDIPRYLIGRKATILARDYVHSPPVCYRVQFDIHKKKTFVLWVDEIKPV